jgi:transcriptional regulator with XRE-family HTH domain
MPRKVPPGSPFGERLYKLRKERGMTQSELAEAIGSSQRAISSYETVVEHPPASVIVKLAKVLRVSTDDMLGLRKPKLTRQSPEAQRLWKKFQQVSKLPEKDRRAIMRMVNSLVSAQGR